MANYTALDLINYIRNKIDEPSEIFFNNQKILDYINVVIRDICEDTLINEKIVKSIFPNDVETVNLPDDFLRDVELYVNNNRYKKISFGDLKMYIGNRENDERVKNVYYIRGNYIKFLQTQKQGDEMTLFYYAYYPELVDEAYSLVNIGELNNKKSFDIIFNGVAMHMYEQDGNIQMASYYMQKYNYDKKKLKTLNNYKKTGNLNWKIKKQSIDNFFFTDDFVNGDV